VSSGETLQSFQWKHARRRHGCKSHYDVQEDSSSSSHDPSGAILNSALSMPRTVFWNIQIVANGNEVVHSQSLHSARVRAEKLNTRQESTPFFKSSNRTCSGILLQASRLWQHSRTEEIPRISKDQFTARTVGNVREGTAHALSLPATENYYLQRTSRRRLIPKQSKFCCIF
jgi:hypothetical protein